MASSAAASGTSPIQASPGLATRLSRAGLWPIRVLWLLIPLIVGPSILNAADTFSAPVGTTIEALAWAAWFIGLVSVFAPSTVTLTLLRTVAPAAVAGPFLAALWAGTVGPLAVAGILYGLVVAAVAFLAVTGDTMVNGSAYGSERRMTLRPPAAVLLGPVQLAWLIVMVGVLTGPLLLAAEQWIVGILALIIGLPAAYFGIRALHQLARRWVVFVPAGFVIHDYWALAESILIQRTLRPLVGPADPADGPGAIDLTGNASGLVLRVKLPTDVPYARRQRGEIESGQAAEFWFSPSLPGQVLAEARVRAVKIG